LRFPCPKCGAETENSWLKTGKMYGRCVIPIKGWKGQVLWNGWRKPYLLRYCRKCDSARSAKRITLPEGIEFPLTMHQAKIFGLDQPDHKDRTQHGEVRP